MAKLLEVSALEVAFRHEQSARIVVSDLSFMLERSRVLGIAGESGSGKTLTALSVMGLLPPGAGITGGEIFFSKNEDMVINLAGAGHQIMRSIRGRNIAMVFQEPMTALNPVKKCGVQAMEPLRVHTGLKKEHIRDKILALFEEVRLPDPARIFDSYPHELSGGQRQRVMIAMAISTEPVLLIADEPTTALDVTVQRSILVLLKELQNKYGMGMLFISHDLDVLKEITDEVLVMRQGRCVEYGPVTSVLNHPVHPYTRGLLASKPDLFVRTKRLPTLRDFATGEATPEISLPVISPEERQNRHQALYQTEPLLVVRGLKTTFTRTEGLLRRTRREVHAVNEVSFDLYRGEVLGLVGESGSGKTTLGRSLLQLVEQSSGSVLYDGQRLDTLGRRNMRTIRQRIQLVFQDPYSSLNPRISAGNALMEPLRTHGLLRDEKARKKRAMKMFEQVKLNPDDFHRFPHQFSGGQRQRIAIARALIMEPECVVCDESVSSLDVSVQAEILNLLNELKETYNLTYIFISHDLSVVKYMSDRIMVMHNGELVETGEADQMFEKPSSEYTQRLIHSLPGKVSGSSQ